MSNKPEPDQLFSQIGFACWQGRPNTMTASHRHNDVELNFVQQGSVTYRFAPASLTVSAGQIALFWAAMPHQLVHAEPDAAMHWLTIPLALFLRWQLPSAFTNALLRGEAVRVVNGAGADRALLQQWQADLASQQSERHAILLLELEARLRRMALDCGSAATSNAEDAGATVDSFRRNAEHMARFIAVHYAEPLRAAQIAREVGLHPNYAMQVFRRVFGLPLTDYIAQHRIAHAQRLLVTTDANVLDVALECGFGSTSRFYAVFKQICKQSPASYRAAFRVWRE